MSPINVCVLPTRWATLAYVRYKCWIDKGLYRVIRMYRMGLRWAMFWLGLWFRWSASANDVQSTRLIQSVLAYWRDAVWSEQTRQDRARILLHYHHHRVDLPITTAAMGLYARLGVEHPTSCPANTFLNRPLCMYTICSNIANAVYTLHRPSDSTTFDRKVRRRWVDMSERCPIIYS